MTELCHEHSRVSESLGRIEIEIGSLRRRIERLTWYLLLAGTVGAGVGSRLADVLGLAEAPAAAAELDK